MCAHRVRRLAEADEVRDFIVEARLNKKDYEVARLQRADVNTTMYPSTVHFRRHYGHTFNTLLGRRRPGSGLVSTKQVCRFAANLTQREYDLAIRSANSGRSRIYPASWRFPKVYGSTFGELLERHQQTSTRERREHTRLCQQLASRRAKGRLRARGRSLAERETIYYREILRRYRLTREGLGVFLAAQNGCCGACNQPPLKGKRLVVDHCHRTGLVRGLLCRTCNVALGLLEEDPQRIYSLADYLLRARVTHVSAG